LQLLRICICTEARVIKFKKSPSENSLAVIIYCRKAEALQNRVAARQSRCKALSLQGIVAAKAL
jgi:hypothetical protein